METAVLKLPYLIANDLPELRRFYEQSLGLSLRFQDGEKWCQLQAGKLDLALSSPEEAAPCPGGAVLVFSVQSLEAAQAQILQAGGVVLHTRAMGSHGQVSSCRDIEGNFFQIHARAATPGS